MHWSPLLLSCFALFALAGGCGADATSRARTRGLTDPSPGGAAGQSAAGQSSAAAGSGGAAPGAELRERARTLLIELGSQLDDSRRVSLDQLCSDVPCPTLEQVLKQDTCEDVVVGCGLWQVQAGSNSYWYEGFGSPPVGVSTIGPADGAGPWASTRSLACAQLQTVCSTCGRNGVPFCTDEPASLPEPPVPEPVPGCACEADPLGDRLVSLDCFCSLYPCPPYEALLGDCPPDDGDTYASVRADWSCDWVWLHNGAHSGQAFAYDRVSRQLVAALAFSNGPVTAPCGSYRVRAGAAAGSCSEPRSCRCNGVASAYLVAPGRGEVPDACEEASWFAELLADAPPSD